MSLNLFNKLHETSSHKTVAINNLSPKLQVFSLTGHNVSEKRFVALLPISLGEYSTVFPAMVVEDFPYDVLFGSNFCRHAEIDVSYSSDRLYIGANDSHVDISTSNPTVDSIRAVNSSEVTIAAGEAK